MGTRYTTKGETLGHDSASILPRYEIRSRKQAPSLSHRKKWYSWDYTTQSCVFEADTKRECIEYMQGNANLFVLASTHTWGLLKCCSVCGKNRHISNYYYKFTRDKFHSRCMSCENLADRKRRAKKREADRKEASSQGC